MPQFQQSTTTKRPMVTALILEGFDDGEVIAISRCSLNYVRNIRRELRRQGRLAGRNVG